MAEDVDDDCYNSAPSRQLPEESIIEVFSRQEFLNSLSTLSAKLDSAPAAECADQFISLLKSTLLTTSSKRNNKRKKSSSFPQNTWFDEECKQTKRIFKKSARKLKADPDNPLLRDLVWKNRRNYKNLIRQKKRNIISKLHVELKEFKSKNPREFWRKIASATSNTDDKEIPVPTDELGAYFESLLTGPEDRSHVDLPHDFEMDPILDDPIEEEEVRTAISCLKKNKAPGLDGLSPAAFKLFNSHLISFTTSLFNRLLEQGTFPDSWSSGAIKPIYKKSCKEDPNNYRGITLLPILSKLFTAILQERVQYWADVNDKINDAQFGFRQGRTTDPLFIMNIAIQHHKKGKQHYTLALLILQRPLTLSTMAYYGVNLPQWGSVAEC